MKYHTILFSCLFILIQLVSAQDLAIYLQQVNRLVLDKKFAAAYSVLDSAMRTSGFQPELIDPMVDNILKNYYYHRDFKVFYLRDEPENNKNSTTNKMNESRVVAVRYPDRLLQRSIEQSPQFAWTYKLLGDYYYLQISQNTNLELFAPDSYADIREKVFSNYLRAVQLGFSDANVNRWLGRYYEKANQVKLAKQYYQMNIDNNFEDPATFCFMADIYLSEKKYSQAYNYAIKALQNFSSLNPELRYQATRWAALSLYNLGEEERFLDYISDCIQIFPDAQEAYLDLLAYYEERNDPERLQKIVRQMLLNNPYSEKGYKYLERYCVKNNDYHFAESLFEELMIAFEHSDEAMGNIYRFRGNLLFRQGLEEEAKKLWDISRNYFNRFLPEDSPILKQIGDISRESSLK